LRACLHACSSIEYYRSLRLLHSFPTRRSSDLGDMVEYLPKWREIDELVKLVQFVGVGRPGFHKCSQYPILWVDVPETEISSTLIDRKSTRLNSSHVSISYAVFCLKKKKVQ